MIDSEKPETPEDKDALLRSNRARRIERSVTRKSRSYGGESREKVQRVLFPGLVGSDDPRNLLVDLLAVAVGEDHANAIVDALDVYLATDPADREPRLQWQPPNPRAERDAAIRERDEAVARAERAEREMVKGKKKKPVAAQPREELRVRTAARRSLIRK